jgi:hypothetical protein
MMNVSSRSNPCPLSSHHPGVNQVQLFPDSIVPEPVDNALEFAGIKTTMPSSKIQVTNKNNLLVNLPPPYSVEIWNRLVQLTELIMSLV